MQHVKIRRLAGVLYGVSVAGLIVIPLVLLAVLVPLAVGVSIVPLAEGAASTGGLLWLGVAVNCLPALAFLWVLDTLRKLFAQYRDGAVLTHGAAALILKAGRGLLLVAGLNVLVQPVSSVLLSWQAAPGMREVSVGIGSAEIGFLFAAGLLTLIGWAMTDAARQAEENRRFV